MKTSIQLTCLKLPAVLLTLLSLHLAAGGQVSSAANSPTAAAAPARLEYTLPPAKLQKAKALYRQSQVFQFLQPLYGMIVLVALLQFGVVARFRDFAERNVPKRWLHGLVVLPLFLLSVALLMVPLDIYQQYLGLKYGLSIQGWASWWADWVKALLLTAGLDTVLLLLLYAMVRRSPKRWWFYGWLLCVPVVVFIMFISPLVIDPLFYKFTPLEQTNPELVTQIERVVQRGGLEIPRSRMYSMNASEKLTGDNAYVTGFGASKRVVVWDTTQKHLTDPEIMFVFGHEMGHYVLHHVVKGIVGFLALMLVLLYLAYLASGWMLRRWGGKWRIRDLGDWASVPMLALLLAFFSFVSTPLQNGVSRYFEHQADTYGLEVTHGLTPDSGHVAAESFQILGENWLEYPDVGAFFEWWGWNHPVTRKRLQYAEDYDPWAQGKQPQFVKGTADGQ